ncbi:arginase family protein [Thalassococcus sp. S3]|uniref:arginase family protein n=1 Tax=Thalassococcus sp. S3 TaxID=2017482 RepID=UPI0010242746|nr:arginase family protein [Thalassococcus sp. S3]QBF32282.1 arginase [Thalassococcus sp. S3]
MSKLADMFGGGAHETLLGLPAGTEGDIVVLGADCATPYPSVGAFCAQGPAAMRAGAADYSGDLDKLNFDLGHEVLPHGVTAVDAGDLDVTPSDPAGNRTRIEAASRECLGQGAIPMLLGGDDSVQSPMLAAFADQGPITVLQIDAHIDWRDEVEGERFGLSSTMRRASEMQHVERIVQVGARGIGSAGRREYQDALDWGASIVPAQDIHQSSIADCAALIPEGVRVVVCFDCDGLDPSIMPAVIAPTSGGLTYAQAWALLRAVAARATLVGFAMVEFMPEADVNGRGALTAGQLLTSTLGLLAGQVAARR